MYAPQYGNTSIFAYVFSALYIIYVRAQNVVSASIIRIIRTISLINLKYIRNIIAYFKYFYNFAYENMKISQYNNKYSNI